MASRPRPGPTTQPGCSALRQTYTLVQQLTGINTVIYYAPRIFKAAGLGSSSAAIWASVSVSVVNVAATFIAIRFVDRIGRKPLLMIGVSGMVAALGALAVLFDSASRANGFSLHDALTIGALWVYVIFFAFSLGPIVWIMIAEVFPQNVRGPGNGIATMAGWAGNLLVSLTFLSLIDELGETGTFALYAAIGLASLAFIQLRVPETKGRTLEQIQAVITRAHPTDDASDRGSRIEQTARP